jgi:hypothetical protein
MDAESREEGGSASPSETKKGQEEGNTEEWNAEG